MIALSNYFPSHEYLHWEEQQQEKHEYIDGQIYAMAGASENHVDITTNLTVILASHLRGGICKVFPTDMPNSSEISAIDRPNFLSKGIVSSLPLSLPLSKPRCSPIQHPKTHCFIGFG